MPEIISLKDDIHITINNLAQPPKAEMKLSRDLPGPYVVMILSQLITTLMHEMLVQNQAGRPSTTIPGGQSSDDNKKT